MIAKKDWVELKSSAETILKQHEIGLIQYTELMALCDRKIAEFPDEAKEAEKELNELTKE